MEYFDLIQQRQSCRNFDPDRPVENKKILRCLEAARLAPSACNSQPWFFHVFTNPTVLEELCKSIQCHGSNAFASQCRALVVVAEQKAKLKPAVEAALGSQHFAEIDIGLAVAQFCLAATEQGLSTCILGWMDEEEMGRKLRLAAGSRVRLAIGIGYAAEETIRPKKRKRLEEMACIYDA